MSFGAWLALGGGAHAARPFSSKELLKRMAFRSRSSESGRRAKVVLPALSWPTATAAALELSDRISSSRSKRHYWAAAHPSVMSGRRPIRSKAAANPNRIGKTFVEFVYKITSIMSREVPSRLDPGDESC